MNEYFIAYEPDLRCYPNYSFEIGDLNGDGRMEMGSLNQNGNRLRAVSLAGEVLLERRIVNHGNWGTPLPCVTDLDGDGRDEVVVPSFGRKFEARVVAFDAQGAEIGAHVFGTHSKDDYGIGVPLLAPIRLDQDGPPGIVAAVAGGHVVALDGGLNEVWRAEGFRNDFGHEFHVADVDGDGSDEVAFCTMDHLNGGFTGDDWNVGELVLLDHDGTTLLRRTVDEYCRDTHFDDVAMADFRGIGRAEILLEKGFLINLNGDVIWDVSDQFDHGQWIAHTSDPQGKGRLIFISELWESEGKSALFSGDGRKLMEIEDLPRSQLDPGRFPGWRVLPTRCHIVRWTTESDPEIFLSEQACSPTSHDCFSTTHFELKAFFLDLQGKLVGTLPFEDAQIEGYWYNGEVRSRVADVDGDGQQEMVFPRQDGRVMVIKKRV